MKKVTNVPIQYRANRLDLEKKAKGGDECEVHITGQGKGESFEALNQFDNILMNSRRGENMKWET